MQKHKNFSANEVSYFVPASNLNSNGEIFTQLHDAPSNFSSSNQDPNWSFDISTPTFAVKNTTKIFSDDKFKNMISMDAPVATLYDSVGDAIVGDSYSSSIMPTFTPVFVGSQIDTPVVTTGIAQMTTEPFAPITIKPVDAPSLYVAPVESINVIADKPNPYAPLPDVWAETKPVDCGIDCYGNTPILKSDVIPPVVITPSATADTLIVPTKKSMNWLPIFLIAAVGGYLYMNRKK